MSVVITVSRQLGSQGSYIAAEVARRLELRYLDREILQRAAEMAGYPNEAMLRQLEQQERVPGLLDQIITALGSMPLTPTIASATLREAYLYDERVALLMHEEQLNREEALHRLAETETSPPSDEVYVALIRQVVEEFARIGNVIIVGRGGQVILQQAPYVLHVRVEAPVEVRIRNLMQRLGIDEREAERQIHRSDKERQRYLKHFYGVRWDDVSLYHLVLNTGKLSVDLAAHIICEAACQLSPKVPL